MARTILTLLAVTFMFGIPMVFADGHTEPAAEEHTGPAFIKVGQSYRIETAGRMGIYTGKILKHEGGSWYLWEFQQSKIVEDEEGEKGIFGSGRRKIYYTSSMWVNINNVTFIKLIDDFRSEEYLEQLEAAAGAEE